MKRILVTGGAGGVGRELVGALLQRGDQVTVFDLPFMDFSVFDGVSGVTVIKGDITDAAVVRSAVRDVDTVLHLAALLPPASEKSRERTFAVNVQGTKNLLDALRQNGNQARVILTSSVATYGDTTKATPPIRITQPQRPIDVYGESKVATEEAILASGLPYTILRISGISVPALLDPPEVWPFMRDQRMEFVNRADVIRALVAAVYEPGAVNKVFNIAGGASWQMLGHEYAEQLCRLLDVPVGKTTFRDSPGWCDWYDTAESQAILGYQETLFPQFLEFLDRAIQEALG